MVSRLELAEIIGKQTLTTESTEDLKAAIASYLLEENLSDELESLMRDVLAYRAAQGFIEATIISAHPLTDMVRGDVKDLIKQEYPAAKHVTINELVDPEVVGGLRIELAGEELDLTVKGKLNTFKRLTAARKD